MSDGLHPGAGRPEDDDAALAAEFVLRLLPPGEEADCAARAARDTRFAALVEGWRRDLAAFDGDFVPVPPPAALKRRIEARLFQAPARASLPRRLWQSAGLWRAVAAAAVAVAVWFASFAPQPPVPGLPDARLVSALLAVDSELELFALIEPEAAVLSVNRTSGAAAPGRVLELWLIEGDAAPVSLGVLPDAPQARVPLDRALAARIAAGALLAISDEPEGGSPTGAPTGAVLAAGPVREI